MQRHSPPHPRRHTSSPRVEPCRRHRNPPKAKSCVRRGGKSSTRVYMSLGCGIIRRMKVHIYRRNGGDMWPWQGDMVFVTKNRVGHKRMRAIARLHDQTISPVVTRKLASFTSRCAIRLKCMDFRADTSCQIKDRATSSVNDST